MGVSSGAVGAPDATSAVRGFMAAAKVQSMQSLSMWWGDSQGATRDLIAKDELEKRELIMLRCLKHDRYLSADAGCVDFTPVPAPAPAADAAAK